MSKKDIKINIPVKENDLLKQALERINSDKEIKTLWKVINVNAMERMGYTDHGPVHFQIVANIALRFSRMLTQNKIKLSVEKDYSLSSDHGELVIFLASLMHDLGMTIERHGHEQYSLFLTNNLLKKTLDFLPVDERTILISETLHAIISHRKGGMPLTLEAGIVRVADALDMSEGRSRIPYEAGKHDIHSVSAAAIDDINIVKGKSKPIEVQIVMNNSAGVFQIDELLKSKLKGSGIEKYVIIKAFIKGKTEKELIHDIVIDY